MPRRVITRPVYDALLEAFKEVPGNYAQAAARAGVGWRFARTGWEKGWSRQQPWALPIKGVLDSLRAEAAARARDADLAKRTAEDARHQRTRETAIDALEQEAKMVQMTRGNAIATVGITSRVLQSMLTLVENINNEAKTATLSIKDKMKLLSALAYAARQGGESVLIALEAQRKHLGAPDMVLRVENGGDVGYDVNDAIAEIQAANLALQRAHRNGIITLGTPPGVVDAPKTNGVNGANGVH